MGYPPFAVLRPHTGFLLAASGGVSQRGPIVAWHFVRFWAQEAGELWRGEPCLRAWAAARRVAGQRRTSSGAGGLGAG